MTCPTRAAVINTVVGEALAACRTELYWISQAATSDDLAKGVAYEIGRARGLHEAYFKMLPEIALLVDEESA